MKYVALCVMVIALLVAAFPAVHAADWSYGFALNPLNPSICGVKSTASDGFESNDRKFGDAWVPEATIVAVGSRLGSNFLAEDYRAPLLPGQTKTWQVNVECIHFGIWPPPASVTVSWSPQTAIPSNLNMTLRLLNAPMGYMGPTFWDLRTQPIGSINLPWGGVEPPFPFPTPSYNFEYKVTAVPEPSGIVAVLSGIMGMAGVIRRRR